MSMFGKVLPFRLTLAYPVMMAPAPPGPAFDRSAADRPRHPIVLRHTFVRCGTDDPVF
jgi:hypothetical protein